MIKIRNWDRFQHYKKPKPVWIKLYRDLLGDYNFSRLSIVDKWTLIGLYLLAAETDNAIPNDLVWLQNRLQLDDPPAIQTLQALSFITVVESSRGGLEEVYAKKRREEKRREEKEEEPTCVGELFELTEEDGELPAVWMHRLWGEKFGVNGHPIKLTADRSQKYGAMYREQLEDTPDPMMAWQAVLYALSKSKHHTGNRAYLMPESFLLNENRRDRWVQQAIDVLKNGASQADRNLKAKQEELVAYLNQRGGK